MIWPSLVPSHVANVQGRAYLEHIREIFWVSNFFSLFQCKDSKDLTLKGKDEDDPLMRQKVCFGRAYLLASLGLSRIIKIRQTRDHPRLSSPLSPFGEIVRVQFLGVVGGGSEENSKSTKFP